MVLNQALQAGALRLAMLLSVNTMAVSAHAADAGVYLAFSDRFETWTCTAKDMPQPNAGATESSGIGGCPAGMLRVDSFCIDQYEASLVSTADGSAGLPLSPFRNPGEAEVRAISAANAVPQAYISGAQAEAACAAAGKRLCSDVEWLRACRGSQGTTWPYGNSADPARCNGHRSLHPAVEYFATVDPWIWEELDHPCLNQLWHGLDRSGANPDCASEDGVLDMVGNLAEWTADAQGTLRGGFYVDTTIQGAGCLYLNTAPTFAAWNFSSGFRCCADSP